MVFKNLKILTNLYSVSKISFSFIYSYKFYVENVSRKLKKKQEKEKILSGAYRDKSLVTLPDNFTRVDFFTTDAFGRNNISRLGRCKINFQSGGFEKSNF